MILHLLLSPYMFKAKNKRIFPKIAVEAARDSKTFFIFVSDFS